MIKVQNNSEAYYALLIYKFIILIMALLFAFNLANLIPMDDTIKDRLNYIHYASESEIIFLRYLSRGFLHVLTNEPVWLFINIALNSAFEPKTSVRLIVFFTTFTTSFLILRANPKFFIFLLLFLLLPQVIDKFVVHLRQGLAISIFLLGWFTSSRYWRWILFGLTPFIHASFFFVLFLYILISFLKRLKFALDLKTLTVVLLGLLINLRLGFIVEMSGARQTNRYDFIATETSGLGFLFWLGILGLYWLQGRNLARKQAFAIAAIVYYLTTYFLIEVSVRIFESMIILVLIAGLSLTSWRRKIFMAVILTFFGLSWILRLNEPWLGWGTGL